MIVFIHHSVNPYRVAFFNKLAASGIFFKVYFLSRPSKNRMWRVRDYLMNFDYEFLSGSKIYFPGSDHSYFQLNTGIWRRLKKDNPEVIITIGWNYLAAFFAFIFAKLFRKKYVIWSESTKYEKSIQRKLTLPLIKLIVKKSDYLIAAGTRAGQYLLSLGADKKKIKTAFYTIDTERFIKLAEEYKKETVKIRKKHHLSPKQKIVLYVGGFLERKGIKLLLELARLMRNEDEIVFMFVGFGPLLDEMRQFKKRNSLENIMIVGFIKNEEIMKYYVTCDLFILPSFEETWGLVVNEAMCAGKPVLVSKYAGSFRDLVKDGGNGYVIDPHKSYLIRNKIIKLLSNDKLRDRMGRESSRIIKGINIDQNINVIKEVLLS